MEKERISVFQLVVLLYVCRSFNLFTATLHDVGAGYGAVQLAAYPLAAVFQLALMLPVWLLNTKWKDKNFLFAMNAQTGKMVGDLPVDKLRYNLLRLALAAGITLLLAVSGIGSWIASIFV